MSESNQIQKYISAREQFEAMATYAMELIEAGSGREVESWRPEYGSHIFAKLVLHTVSVLQLAPDLSDKSEEVHVWDPSSLSALVRCIVDSYFNFYYVACDSVDVDEEEFRHLVWQFHGEKARLKHLELIKSSNPMMEKLRQTVSQLETRVTGHSRYAALETSQKNEIRQGRKAILVTNSELALRSGLSRDHYKSTYDFLSSYAHAYPFSLSQLAGFTSDKAALIGIYKLILDHGSIYLAQAIATYEDQYGDFGLTKSAEAAKAIKLWQFVAHNFDTGSDAV